MNWKENSHERLGDTFEQSNAEGSRMMEEITTAGGDEQEEMYYEGEDFDNEIPNQESKLKAERKSVGSYEGEAVNDQEGADSKHEMKEKSYEKQTLIDWVSLDEYESTERRRTIYDLDSYVASNISMLEGLECSDASATNLDTRKDFRYSVSLGLPGIARINLSPLTQKIVGCVIGENVTTEYPWIYVRKEIIEDNLDLHDESSDFLPVRNEVNAYPDKNMLIGFAPSTVEEGQFYICLSEAGRDSVIREIETLRLEQEDRVKNAVFKPIGVWTDLGGGREVDETIVKKKRPLFEIEVESTADLLNAPFTPIDRNVDDQRDGYIELLPYRQKFDNVTRSLVSKNEQAGLHLVDRGVQTRPSTIFNSWFQYNYEYTPIDPDDFDQEGKQAFTKFLNKYTDDMCDQVKKNATWDIYIDDYGNLVRNERDTQAPVPIAYTEHQSYYNGKLSMDKVINDLCWHPLWTGIAAAAYTEHSKSDYLVGPYLRDKVLKACEGNNQVLIWSFNDCLTPKLILECPREVTSVSICPLDGNVIVGGCVSGQVEAVLVETTAQVKYRIAMRSLMSWMREPSSSSVIKPAAMSSLQYSQKAAITQIVWLPIYDKIDKNGRVTSLPADTEARELGWQLATSSEDGTIAFWDLRAEYDISSIVQSWRPAEDKKKSDLRGKKKKRSVQRPDPLLQSISPFKALDGIFRPVYMLQVNYPDEERRAVITTMSIYSPRIRKEQTEPFPSVKDNVTVRKYYKASIEKPDYQLQPMILIGTVEGDVARVSWEGYEFTTGVVVNCENAKWLWSNCSIHDGPVTHSIRSKYLRDVIATVGGKVFAVWREDFNQPVFWRKSTVRYTACCWGTFRPTVLILARADGTAEIWDFIVKSHEPSFTQALSGRIITGIHTHELYLTPQCVAFCDFNGTLRVFTAPADLLNFDESDIGWMGRFVDREVDRIRKFKEWQDTWNETNVDNIEKRKKMMEMEAEKKRLEAEEKVKNEMAEMMSKASKSTTRTRKPAELLEEARDRWKSMELKRMQRVILEKKGLSAEVLERQRAPILQLRQEAKRKKQKIREIMQLRNKIFDDTTAFLFPKQYKYDRRSVDMQTLSFTTEDDETTADIKVLTKDMSTQKKFESPEHEIIHDFMEIQKEALQSMKKNPYEPHFDWRKVLSEGKARRRLMDVDLKRSNRPKARKFSQEVPEVCEPSTDRNTASGYEASEAPTDVDETGL